MSVGIKDYKTAIGQIPFYKDNSDHTQEELDALAKAIPVRCMQNPTLFARYCKDSKLSGRDCSTLLHWAFTQKLFTDNITVRDDITFQRALECYEPVRVSTIVLHRVNYILHECMCVVYSLVDDRLRFASRKAQKTAEEFWDKHLSRRRSVIERTAFVTMLDHLRLTNDAVQPYIDNVYNSLRDYMIFLGYKDVEVKARSVVVLLLAKVAGNSREAFFKDYEVEFGINYAECFRADDMRPMVDSFVKMCDLLGMLMEKDRYGYWMLKGFNAEENLQFKAAWKRIMTVLRDDDLMDEAAQKAIDLNPKVQEEYQHIIKEEEEKLMAESVEKLGEKFKVKRTK